MLFAPSPPPAASFATAWRFVSRRNDVFDGEVISVDTSNRASPGTLFGSATVIVRGRGCSVRKKRVGVASRDRILRSGPFPLTVALAAWLGAAKDDASRPALVARSAATG